NIGEADIAFAGGIELGDLLYAEALLELGPDRGAQAVADHATQAVALFRRVHGLVEQVAAQFADVTEAGGVVAGDVLPEGAGGEPAAQSDGRTAGQGRAPAH